MGMQDRDWYREETRRKAGVSSPGDVGASTSRRYAYYASADGLDQPIGRGWHVAMQVLAWVAILGLLFAGFKWVEASRNERVQLERQLAVQRQLIEEQKRQIEALKPRPKVDFFK